MRLSNIYWQEEEWLRSLREIAHHAPKKPNSECIRHKTDEERKTYCGREVGESVGRKTNNPLRHTGEMAQRHG